MNRWRDGKLLHPPRAHRAVHREEDSLRGQAGVLGLGGGEGQKGGCGHSGTPAAISSQPSLRDARVTSHCPKELRPGPHVLRTPTALAVYK